MSLPERWAMIEKDNKGLSRRQQCALLGVSRSGFYHRPRPPSAEDLEVMRALDEQYLKTPFHGARRMAVALRGQGFQVGRERVGRLMAVMALETLAPEPQTSRRHAGHRGFLYLVAILDWATRYVLAWRLSATLDANFCIDALEAALAMRGTPETVNIEPDRRARGAA